MHCSAPIKMKKQVIYYCKYCHEYNFPTQVLKKIGPCESYSIKNKMQINDNEDIFNVLAKKIINFNQLN